MFTQKKCFSLNFNVTLLLVMVFCFTFCVNESKAQAPGANCAAAVLIGGTGAIPSCTGGVSITDFTTDGAVPSCLTGVYRRDGWYSFINPILQNITVSGTANTASSNLTIQVFGACGGGELGCANNFPANGGQTESLILNLAAGTYFIKITNYSTTAGANMLMANVCVNATPINNNCATPTTLTPAAAAAACGSIPGTTGGATPQATIPADCSALNTTNDDVWYMFTAIATYQFISVTPASTMNITFEVYSTNPCGGAGTSLGCFNYGPGSIDSLTLGTTIGGTYWIRVFDAGTGIPSNSDFSICIQTPPANDNCANAITLTPSAACTPTTGNVNVATFSGIPASGSCGASVPNDDVWYSFVATGTSHTVSVTGSLNFDPGFEVFSGSCPGGLVSILCNAPGGIPNTTITSILPTIIGQTYWVRVYDYGIGYPASTNFTICILNPPPTNDGCAGAIVLSPITVGCVPNANQQTGDVSGATQTIPSLCAGFANDDVWYTFTTNVTASQPYLITAAGNGTFNPVVQVYSLSCGGTSIACVNATGAGGTETITLTTGIQLTASTQYWIRIYDLGAGYPSNTTFTICVTIPPINANCGGSTIFVWGTQAAPANCGGTTAGTMLGASPTGFAAACGGPPTTVRKK